MKIENPRELAAAIGLGFMPFLAAVVVYLLA